MANRPLIEDITDTSGSWLIELVLRRGYELQGLIRLTSTFIMIRIYRAYLLSRNPRVRLGVHQRDLNSSSRLGAHLERIRPSAFCKLATHQQVMAPSDLPERTGETVSTLNYDGSSPCAHIVARQYSLNRLAQGFTAPGLLGEPRVIRLAHVSRMK